MPATTRRHVLLALAGTPLGAVAGSATPPPELGAVLPGARLLGEATLRYFGMQVYDIRLWADDKAALARPEATRLALELRYARALDGAQIAARSLQEMQGIGEVPRERGQRWLAAMREIFPDVNEGDRITGLQLPGEAARFWRNGQPIGELRDAEFTRLFFGIWLSPRSSQPRLREALLGPRGASS
jgi:hypothetical protein